MKHIIHLNGINYEEDIKKIEENIKNNSIFLLEDMKTQLSAYIQYLFDEYNVKNKILTRLRICYNLKLDKKISLYGCDRTLILQPQSMQELLERIEPGNDYTVVIENNSRTLLADVLQQFIYLDYPLTEIDFKLRKEYKDAARVKRFMKRVDKLSMSAKEAIKILEDIIVDSAASEEEQMKLYQVRANAITAFERIKEQIQKARDVELKVAIAASKKTGKSVLANCMFGMELAPTSLELATPNTCVYKRSRDQKYHLKYGNVDQSFDRPEDVYRAVQKEFKSAQRDEKELFTIPDMEIQYVGNGNNFKDYTIYDTPGPDAAGTNHQKSAQEAIEKCDVAVFAIDYSKYLTTSEEEYLSKIKEIFDRNQKFHTLIFVINKMDLALNDKGAKSRVSSIDFIRNRLRSIDKKYSNCVIFATSAQDYFYTLELEKAAQDESICAPLMKAETDWYRELRSVKETLENKDGDEILIDLLSNLDGEVGRIKSQLGYPSVTKSDVQSYSGIPQLMEYIAYVAQSKAREEIVNSIAFEIDSQYQELREITKEIEIVEQALNATQEDIDRVTNLLNEYSAEVVNILTMENLTNQDEKILKKGKLLGSYIDRYQKDSGRKPPLPLNEVLKLLSSDLDPVEETEIIDECWQEVKHEQIKRLTMHNGKVVDIDEVILSEMDIKELIQKLIQKNILNQRLVITNQRLRYIKDDLISLCNERMERVRECTKAYQEKLDKAAINFTLNVIPSFDVSFEPPKLTPKEYNFRFSMRTVLKKEDSKLYGYKELSNFRNFIWELRHGSIDNRVKVKNLTDVEREQLVKSFGDDFREALRRSNFYNLINQRINGLRRELDEAVNQLTARFDFINQDINKKIKNIIQTMDDREIYEKEKDMYIRKKNLIQSIENASRKFMNIWDVVQNDETTPSDMTMFSE